MGWGRISGKEETVCGGETLLSGGAGGGREGAPQCTSAPPGSPRAQSTAGQPSAT